VQLYSLDNPITYANESTEQRSSQYGDRVSLTATLNVYPENLAAGKVKATW